MKLIKAIGSIGLVVLGLGLAAPQIAVWLDELRKPGMVPGQLPIYSPERHSDCIWLMDIGNHTIRLDPWFPVAFAISCILVIVGAWSCRRVLTQK